MKPIQEIENMKAGFYGVEFIGDTVIHPGRWGLLLPLTTTVVSAITATGLVAGKREVTKITTVADVADSLHETSFVLADAGGTVGVWFNTGGGSGPGTATRDLEVTITTGATAAAVATALAAALDADSALIATVSGAEVTVTVVTPGARTDVADTDSGFAFAIVEQGSSATPLATKTLPAGVPVMLPGITSLTLSSGTLLAYCEPPRRT